MNGRIWNNDRNKVSVRLQNRLVSWDGESLQIEADPRHREILIESLGLQESSKSVVAPGIKKKEGDTRKMN